MEVVWMPGGVRTEVHLGGGDTGGAFCLLVDHPPAGWSLPPHLHRDAAETIHVVEGEFEVTVDGEAETLAASQTVHIPAGVVHSSRNLAPDPGRRVLTFTPAGMERLFLELGTRSPERIDPGRALAVATRHGWQFV